MIQLGCFESKIDESIRILKDNEPDGEPYYGATSGGKDSIVLMKLSEMAGVNVEWNYNATTVDPPELVRFLKNTYPNVKINKPPTTMWKLIVKKRMPPTRKVRYCCEVLKEHGGNGRVVITGVRKAESYKRSKREPIECFKSKNKARMIVNPIIYWTNEDVWGFIRQNNMPYCSLYDEGFKRLGCVGCPMANKTRKHAFERWPHFKALYIKAFDKMIEGRLNDGLSTDWTSKQEVFDWWMEQGCSQKRDDNQPTLFE